MSRKNEVERVKKQEEGRMEERRRGRDKRRRRERNRKREEKAREEEGEGQEEEEREAGTGQDSRYPHNSHVLLELSGQHCFVAHRSFSFCSLSFANCVYLPR